MSADTDEEPQGDPDDRRPTRTGFLRRMLARDSREHLWAFLDTLDARPGLKKLLLFGLPAALILAGFGAYSYERWSRTNAVRIARQWLEVGRLDRASHAVQEALTNEPYLPDSWQVASELAWREGNSASSIDYARKASEMSKYDPDYVVAWAEAAVLAGDPDQAREAEEYLDVAFMSGSSRAQRVAGEVARQGGRYEEAKEHFGEALRIDTSAGIENPAIDEVPLGVACLQTGSAADRAKGIALLGPWAANLNWGVPSLRALLADAEAHGDKPAMARLAEELRKHPRVTLGDVPTCLKALRDSNGAAYRAVLGPLEERARANPDKSAQMIGWLNGIGEGGEALRWAGTLSPDDMRKPPIAIGVAEAYRASGRWSDLRDFVDGRDWGSNLEFVRLAYAMVAARKLSDADKAESYWRSLGADARISPTHALFIGDSLVAWGYLQEAAELLQSAGDRPELSLQAYGSLARLYQVKHDAAGEYRAFTRLHSIRPGDRRITNNYVYFGSLTDAGSQSQMLALAEDNLRHDPGSDLYRSTYAFALVCAGQGEKAMEIIAPVKRDWAKSQAVAFAYGAALASVGRKDEAEKVFGSVNRSELDTQAIDWVRNALR
ncbi:MAG TPA: hypothetical protein VGG34_09985 [Opitutaceae bacterium]|jgi:tetratricopeptide (TPR) repeat protein